MRDILRNDPYERITISRILVDPWLNEGRQEVRTEKTYVTRDLQESARFSARIINSLLSLRPIVWCGISFHRFQGHYSRKEYHPCYHLMSNLYARRRDNVLKREHKMLVPKHPSLHWIEQHDPKHQVYNVASHYSCMAGIDKWGIVWGSSVLRLPLENDSCHCGNARKPIDLAQTETVPCRVVPWLRSILTTWFDEQCYLCPVTLPCPNNGQ